MRIIIFIFSFLPLISKSQGFITATLDSNVLVTGDPTGLNIVAKIPRNSSNIQLDLSGILNSGKIEMLTEPSQKTLPSNDFEIIEWKYILTSFDTGYHILPPARLYFENEGKSFEIFSENLGLEINLLPIGQDEAYLQPIKEIIKEPFLLADAIPFILGGLTLLIALIGLFWLYKRNKKGAPISSNLNPIKTINPFDNAISQLNQLENSELIKNQMWKEFHFELSHIFREYIELEFKYPALESTLEEVKRILLKLHPDNQELTAIRDILSKAELIKFAKYEVSNDFHLSALNEIRSFILKIKPLPAEDVEIEKFENQ